MGYQNIYSKAAAENLRRAADEACNYIEDLESRLNAISGLEVSQTNASSETDEKPATIEMVASENDSRTKLKNDVYDYIARYVFGGADSGATERLFDLLNRQDEITLAECNRIKSDDSRTNLAELYNKAYGRIEELEAENKQLEESRDYWIACFKEADERANNSFWRPLYEDMCAHNEENFHDLMTLRDQLTELGILCVKNPDTGKYDICGTTTSGLHVAIAQMKQKLAESRMRESGEQHV